MAPEGTELFVGINRDNQFGPLIMTGMGGVFIEVFNDVSMCLCPISRHEAIGMIERLKASKLLDGYRGSLLQDKEALAEVIVRLSEFATENADTLCEIDLNPIFVYESGKGAIAVDALVVQQGQKGNERGLVWAYPEWKGC
jgi:acyl-CoA synthetase (NDP forming)